MSRLFAIPDIHGRKDLLDLLLEALKEDHGLQLETDKLIFLGDMVDRGPDSKGVMDTIRALQDIWGTDRVVALAGNHEWLMIDACTKNSYDDWYLWGINGGEATQSSFPGGKVPDDYIRWAASLPLFHEEPGFFFSHAPIPHHLVRGEYGHGFAGMNPDALPFSKHALIWSYERGPEQEWSKRHDNGVVGVCGHIHGLKRGVTPGPRLYDHYIFADAGCGCAPWAPLVAVEVRSRTVIRMNPPEAQVSQS